MLCYKHSTEVFLVTFYGGDDLALWVVGCHDAEVAVRGVYLLIECGQHWLALHCPCI